MSSENNAAGNPELTMRFLKHGTVTDKQWADFISIVKLKSDEIPEELVNSRRKRKELEDQFVALSLEQVDIKADIERLKSASREKGS
ncbi:hypothetical protein N9Z53_01535 [Mariniblastus sp.]|nr:hypothetical protein [Mariniblastus sp.]